MADILLGSVGKIIEIGLKINEAVKNVKQNEKECLDIQSCVARVTSTIDCFRQTVKRFDEVSPGTEAIHEANVMSMHYTLEDLAKSLKAALDLVTKCQRTHAVRRLIGAGAMAKELCLVQDDILRKVTVGSFASNVLQLGIMVTSIAPAAPPPQRHQQPNESLYEQKPEEPAPVLPFSVTESTATRSKPHTSRFEYVENTPAPKTGSISEDNHMSGHVAPPKSSNFFAEFGMDSGYHKKSASSSSKVQLVEESASIGSRRRFIEALAPTFGRPLEADPTSCRRATFLSISGIFTFLVHFAIPLQFPKQQPVLTLQSSQHCNADGTPIMSPPINDYPWSPKWDQAEMVERIYDFLTGECQNFKKFCSDAMLVEESASIGSRRRFIEALAPTFGRPLEADPTFCRRATFLSISGIFTFLVHFAIPLQFPKQQPVLTLQSSQHFNADGTPIMSPPIIDYPWSPKWDQAEMVERIYDFLTGECQNFK